MVKAIRLKRKKPKGSVLVDKVLAPETRRQIAARHEAAHIVVAHGQGVEVGRVTLDSTEAGEVNPHFDAMSSHGTGTPLEHARIAIAGRIQEDHDLGTLGLQAPDELYEGGFHDDSLHFKQWLFTAAGSDQQRAAALVQPMMRETIDMLNGNHEPFSRLAQALFERGTLEEADILAILGPYPEVTPETVAERERTMAAVKETGGRPWLGSAHQPLTQATGQAGKR